MGYTNQNWYKNANTQQHLQKLETQQINLHKYTELGDHCTINYLNHMQAEKRLLQKILLSLSYQLDLNIMDSTALQNSN